MIKVLLGHQVANEPPQLGETNCRLVYVDANARLLWLWRPNGNNGAYLALRIDNDPPLYLGSKTVTDGHLAFYEIDEEQFLRFKGTKAFEAYTNDPAVPIPESIALTQSLHEYVQVGVPEPDLEILHSIAWYASSRWIRIQAEGLTHVLRGVTFEDLTRNHPAYMQRFVPRDPQLFEELRRVIEARRLVFVLGGMKSGLTSFLEQFKQEIANQNCGDHLPADFSPSLFKEVQSFLGSYTEMLARRGSDVDTASLFCTLAYAAYQSLLDCGANLNSLAAFVPSLAARDTSEFALQYISEFARRPAPVGGLGPSSQVEFFLVFVGKLLTAAEKIGKLTVILSFPGLANWFRETRGQNTAERVSRSLWTDLKSFTTMNYDTVSGQPKKGSVMSEYKHDVGIVVGIHRLPFPDISEAFCRQSVLVMPPYDNGELSTLWHQRTRIVPSQKVLDRIRLETGAAPWFVNLLADCFAAAAVPSGTEGMEDREIAQLRSAIEYARNVLLDKPIMPTQDSLEKLRGRWRLYVEDLRSRMSPAALTDRKTLLDLIQASETRKQMPRNLQAAEWLESGLIWFAHPIRKHTLMAFDQYPWVRTFPKATFISLFIDYLLQPELKQVAVS